MLARILDRSPLHPDVGLLLLRLGVGLPMVLFHGWAKLTGGPERWEGVGGAMGNLGLGFAPTFWGFLAAFSESIGAILLVLGILFRPAAAMLTFTMLVAAVLHLNMPAENPNSGWSGASHALELMAGYLALLLCGAGKYVVPGIGSRTS